MRFNLTNVLLDEYVSKNPQKNAILFNDDKLTYLQLQQEVNRLVNGLRGLGIGPWDRILLRMQNIPMSIIAHFACWRMGAIPVLINPLQRGEEIKYRANDTEGIAIIVQDTLTEEVDKVKEEMPSMKHFIATGGDVQGYINSKDLMKGQPTEASTFDTGRHHIGRITYSSGSTGHPKGAVSTFRDMLAAADTHGRHLLKLNENDVIGGHPAITFAYGSVNFTYEPWRFGATLSIGEKITPEHMFKLIEKHRITVLTCVPTFFRMMLEVKDADKYDLSSVRIAHSASEPLPYTTYKGWKDRFKIEILDCLGSSELAYSLATPMNMPESKRGCTGLPIVGVEAKIVDQNFKELPRGEVGELVFRGPCGTIYWRKPDKQHECVREGWSRLGISFMEDEDGYFWYKGRTDDLIVSAGYKIPASDVEGAINSHPLVLESAVTAMPDSVRGNVVLAIIVLKNYDKKFDDEKLKTEIQEYVKRKIEPYKYPREVIFLKPHEVPRTSTGKIKRHVLKELATEYSQRK